MASVTQPAGTAPAGKGKSKKNKETKLDADAFLGNSVFKLQSETSWADIMDDEDVIAPSMMNVGNVSLPSAPKSVQGPEIDFDAIPVNGPFRAQVANLSYEITEDQLTGWFVNLTIKNLRLNSDSGRPSGTASVEFDSKQDLIKALELNNRQLNGRSVRIFLPNQDRFGDRGGRGGPGGRNYVDNTPMNWRSADRGAGSTARADGFPPKPDRVFPPPSSDYGQSRGFRSGGGGRFGGDGEGSYRPPRNDSYGYGRRDGYDGDRRRDDDGGFGGRRDGPRRDRYGGADEGRASGQWNRGPPRPVDGPAEAEETGAGGGGGWRNARPSSDIAPPPSSDRYERRDNRGFGGNRDQDSYGPPRGEYGRRRDDNDGYDRGAPVRGGDDLYEPTPAPRRTSGGDDYEAPRSFAPAPPRDRAMSGRSDRSNPDHHSQDHDGHESQAPRRSALRPEVLANLLGGGEEEEKAKPASYNSIFGSAKPVDTLKREMEIEKKLAEEKAAAAEKEAAAKAEAAAAAGAGGATSPAPSGNAGSDSERGPRGDRPPRDRAGPRSTEGGVPPPRMRRENGEAGGHRGGGDRGPRRQGDRYGERNGGGGDMDRRGPRDGHRNRMGVDGAGNGQRAMRGGPRSDGSYGGGYGERSRGFGGDRRDGGGQRYNRGGSGDDDGPSTRYYNNRTGGPGSGGRGFDHDIERNRYISDSDDKDVKNYITTNKYQYLPETEDHVSD